MIATTKQRVRIDRLDDGEWLSRLLVDVQSEIARQPTAGAVERIRGRLADRMERPAKAAA